MWLGVKKSSFWFYSILLLILAYPFNIRLLKFLSPPDILFALFFVVAVFWGGLKKSKISPLVHLFFLFMLVSMFIGSLFFGFSLNYMVFLYKYLVVFVLVWFLLSADLNRKQVIFLLNTMLFTFCFLVLYAYFYQYRVFTGVSLYPRPDFPFSSSDGIVGGAHLYGAYLSTGLMACSAYWIFLDKRRTFVWVPLLFLSFGAILLTGSRAPMIAILIGYGILTLICFFGKKMAMPIRKLGLLILIVIGIGFVMSTVFIGKIEVYEKTMVVIDRAIRLSNIVSDSDSSVMGRAQKIELGTNTVLNGPVVFGTGVSSTPFVWVDNSVARLIIDAGFGGLALFFAILVVFIANASRIAVKLGNIRLFYVFLIVCITYFVNSISTEFFLVTRSIFPFAILVCLIYKLMETPGNHDEG